MDSNSNNKESPPAPSWGVWGTSSDALSSTAAAAAAQASNHPATLPNNHRRGASLPLTFMFPPVSATATQLNEDVVSPLPATTGTRPRLGQRAAAHARSASATQEDILDAGLLSSPQPPHHRRVGSNPLVVGAESFGPSLLQSFSASAGGTAAASHRRSATFDPLDLSQMTSLLDAIPTSPLVLPAVPAPSPPPPAPAPAVPIAGGAASTNEALQAQLAMQQHLILQQQQWLMAMQQQVYYPPQPQQQQPAYNHHYQQQQQQYHPSAYQRAPAPMLHHQQRRNIPAPMPSNSSAHDVLLAEYKQSGVRPGIDMLVSTGSVHAFALDAHGSRFLQYQMEVCTPEEREMLVQSSLDTCIALMQDTFGNYVMQNFFTHSKPAMRTALAQRMQGHMLHLTIDPHGCRVVQRMLDLVDLPVRNALLHELISGARENIIVAARNTHGTHVLQKTVSMLRRDGEQGKALLLQMEHQISLDVVALLLHANSYRLVLNVLGDCDRTNRPSVGAALDTILNEQDVLSKDQHGNFILQHLLEVPAENKRVLAFVLANLVELSRHKFASHLVEKCFAVGSNQVCLQFTEELLRPKNGSASALVELMTDPYANFVVQKAFDRLGGSGAAGQALRAEMVALVQANSEMLARFTYGRHILGHIVHQPQTNQRPPVHHQGAGGGRGGRQNRN